VRSVLSSRHVTGIRVFRGQEVGEGDWSAIIDRGTWREAQARRSYRSSGHDRRGWWFYLLRGLVVQEVRLAMAGSTSKDASYMCARHTYLGSQRCTRRIGAARLEDSSLTRPWYWTCSTCRWCWALAHSVDGPRWGEPGHARRRVSGSRRHRPSWRHQSLGRGCWFGLPDGRGRRDADATCEKEHWPWQKRKIMQPDP
jgi:hypothetical protein